jgi:hypothetical protein
MLISVNRIKRDSGLTLRRKGETHEDDYEATIHPGESALGYTYEEWDAALGPKEKRRLELVEDGTLRPQSDEFDAPADGHA